MHPHLCLLKLFLKTIAASDRNARRFAAGVADHAADPAIDVDGGVIPGTAPWQRAAAANLEPTLVRYFCCSSRIRNDYSDLCGKGLFQNCWVHQADQAVPLLYWKACTGKYWREVSIYNALGLYSLLYVIVLVSECWNIEKWHCKVLWLIYPVYSMLNVHRYKIAVRRGKTIKLFQLNTWFIILTCSHNRISL